MDRDEKKALRERIGEHLDVSGSRLSDDEARFLAEFIDSYDKTHRGKSHTRKNRFTSFSSEGKYIRHEEFTDTFTDDIGIRQDYRYHDDDGQSGESSTHINDARGILNWFHEHG